MGFMGVLRAFGIVDELLSNALILNVLKWTAVIFAFFAAAGVKERLTIPIATILMLVHGGVLREYSHFFHTMVMPLQFAIFLSLHCWQNFRHWSDEFAFGFLRAWFTGSYFLAALSKFANGGWLWWHGDSIHAVILQNSLNKMHIDLGFGDAIAGLSQTAYSFMGISTLLFEMLAPLILVSQRFVLLLHLGLVGLHIGILLSQGILFLDLIVLNLVFAAIHKFQMTYETRLPFRPAILALSLLISVWTIRLESYPFTSWQMYSGVFSKKSIPVWQMGMRMADGSIKTFSPDQFIAALTDCRYRDYFFAGPEQTRKLLERVLPLATSADAGVVALKVVQYTLDADSLEQQNKVLNWQVSVGDEN